MASAEGTLPEDKLAGGSGGEDAAAVKDARSPLVLAAEVVDRLRNGKARIEDGTLVLTKDDEPLHQEISDLKMDSGGKDFSSLQGEITKLGGDEFSDIVMEPIHYDVVTFDQLYERTTGLKNKAFKTSSPQKEFFEVRDVLAVDKKRTIRKSGELIHHVQLADNTAVLSAPVDAATFACVRPLVQSSLSERKPDPQYATPHMYDVTVKVMAMPKTNQYGAVSKVQMFLGLDDIGNERPRPRNRPTRGAIKILRSNPQLTGLVGLHGANIVVIFEDSKTSERFRRMVAKRGNITNTRNGLFVAKYPGGIEGMPEWRLGLAYVHEKVYCRPGGNGFPLDDILEISATNIYQSSRGTMTGFSKIIPFLTSYHTYEKNKTKKYDAIDRTTSITLVLEEDMTPDIQTLIESPPLSEDDLKEIGVDLDMLHRILAAMMTPASQRLIREVAKHFSHTIQEVVAVLPSFIFKVFDQGVFVEDQKALTGYIKLVRAVLDEDGESPHGEFAISMTDPRAREILGDGHDLVLEKLEKDYHLIHHLSSTGTPEYLFEIPSCCRDAASRLRQGVVGTDRTNDETPDGDDRGTRPDGCEEAES